MDISIFDLNISIFWLLNFQIFGYLYIWVNYLFLQLYLSKQTASIFNLKASDITRLISTQLPQSFFLLQLVLFIESLKNYFQLNQQIHIMTININIMTIKSLFAKNIIRKVSTQWLKNSITIIQTLLQQINKLHKNKNIQYCRFTSFIKYWSLVKQMRGKCLFLLGLIIIWASTFIAFQYISFAIVVVYALLIWVLKYRKPQFLEQILNYLQTVRGYLCCVKVLQSVVPKIERIYQRYYSRIWKNRSNGEWFPKDTSFDSQKIKQNICSKCLFPNSSENPINSFSNCHKKEYLQQQLKQKIITQDQYNKLILQQGINRRHYYHFSCLFQHVNKLQNYQLNKLTKIEIHTSQQAKKNQEDQLKFKINEEEQMNEQIQSQDLNEKQKMGIHRVQTQQISKKDYKQLKVRAFSQTQQIRIRPQQHQISAQQSSKQSDKQKNQIFFSSQEEHVPDQQKQIIRPFKRLNQIQIQISSNSFSNRQSYGSQLNPKQIANQQQLKYQKIRQLFKNQGFEQDQLFKRQEMYQALNKMTVNLRFFSNQKCLYIQQFDQNIFEKLWDNTKIAFRQLNEVVVLKNFIVSLIDEINILQNQIELLSESMLGSFFDNKKYHLFKIYFNIFQPDHQQKKSIHQKATQLPSSPNKSIQSLKKNDFQSIKVINSIQIKFCKYCPLQKDGFSIILECEKCSSQQKIVQINPSSKYQRYVQWFYDRYAIICGECKLANQKFLQQYQIQHHWLLHFDYIYT